MIFSFLACFGLSLLMEITPSNINTVLGTKPHPPVFLCIVSAYCHHCQEMKPEWEKITKKYEYDPNIVIATIDYDAYRSLSGKFDQFGGVPAIFWVKKTPDVADIFRGNKTFDGFEQFMFQRQQSQIIPIYNHTALKNFVSDHKDSSIFLLQGEISPEVKNTIEDILFWMRRFSVEFIHLQYEEFRLSKHSTPYLTNFFTGTSRFIDYEGDFTNSTLFPYMYQHKFQPITNVTQMFLDRCSSDPQIRRFVLFQDSDSEPFYIGNLTNLTLRYPKINIGTIVCRKNYKTCQKFGMKYHSFKQLTVVEPKWNRYYTFNGEFDDEKVSNFLDKALAGKLPAEGPGAGWKGFIYKAETHLKSTKNLVIFILVIVVILTGLTALCQEGFCSTKAEKDGHQRHKNE